MKRNALLAAQRAVFRAEITTVEKLVTLALLDHWSKRSPQPYPSIARLCKWASCDARSVRRAFDTLKAVGWLKVVANTGEHGENGYDISKLLAGRPPAQRHPTPGTAPPPAQRHPGTRSVDPRHSAGAPPGTVPPEGIQREGTQEGTQGESARKRARPPIGIPIDFAPKQEHQELAARLGVNLELDVLEWRGRNAGKRIADPDGSLLGFIAGTAKRNGHGRTNGHARRGAALAPPRDSYDPRDDDYAEIQ